jgi:nitrite reductase/ring-hydroxylating ferredoxin subunit
VSDPPNLARPPIGAALIALNALAEGEARALDFNADAHHWSVIVVRSEGRAYAYENRCPHAGLPLDRPDGQVTVDMLGFLVCSAHLASFRLTDGAYAGGPKAPGSRGLTRVKVRVEAGMVVLA